LLPSSTLQTLLFWRSVEVVPHRVLREDRDLGPLVASSRRIRVAPTLASSRWIGVGPTHTSSHWIMVRPTLTISHWIMVAPTLTSSQKRGAPHLTITIWSIPRGAPHLGSRRSTNPCCPAIFYKMCYRFRGRLLTAAPQCITRHIFICILEGVSLVLAEAR
jgi:hypothetical protein